MELVSRTLQHGFPAPEMPPLPGKPHGRLRLGPVEVLRIIDGPALAAWALAMAERLSPPRLARGCGGRPPVYPASCILLTAVVQGIWRKSYSQMIDWIATNPPLAQALGFGPRTISQGQYWDRRAALGSLPFLFFFLGLVAHLIRLGALRGEALIVDSTLLSAWSLKDPGGHWQRYAGKKLLFGYKVHTVLCHALDLPVFVVVTPAQVQDMTVGWLIVLASALLFGFRVLVVYADAGYFERKLFWVCQVLGAHPAINYNLRRAGKRKLATPFFLEQWHRLVIVPRKAIERHFAWAKRYFGLKFFQCRTLPRVTQFVLLTYIAILAVALAAIRYQRPELCRCRSMVLANL
jgi:hypothetical protein